MTTTRNGTKRKGVTGVGIGMIGKAVGKGDIIVETGDFTGIGGGVQGGKTTGGLGRKIGEGMTGIGKRTEIGGNTESTDWWIINLISMFRFNYYY